MIHGFYVHVEDQVCEDHGSINAGHTVCMNYECNPDSPKPSVMQHKSKRHGHCRYFQQANNYMRHQPTVMCYLVGVPQSDGAAQGKLSHQQVIHPAEGKLQVFHFIMLHVPMYGH